MKTFNNWLEEFGSMAIKNSDMNAPDDRRINKICDIARHAAEKHPDKLIESLWRVANDKHDDMMKQMLEKVDPAHMGRTPHKAGFGMGDNDGKREIDDFVPSSADAGTGDVEGV